MMIRFPSTRKLVRVGLLTVLDDPMIDEAEVILDAEVILER